jgi:hypothetical protein
MAELRVMAERSLYSEPFLLQQGALHGSPDATLPGSPQLPRYVPGLVQFKEVGDDVKTLQARPGEFGARRRQWLLMI